MKKFISELDAYPGSFELPEPFLERHLKVWWKKAIEPLSGRGKYDYEFYDPEWDGIVSLITGFGKWDVENVPVGDLQTDGVPMAVKVWVMEVSSAYIYPFLPPRAKLKILGTFV